MIPKGYNAELAYTYNKSILSFPLVVTSETSALEAQIKSSTTRYQTVSYPWLSRYNPSVTITVIFESQIERNKFASFIRDWQKRTTKERFDTLTYKHKNWDGTSGTTQFECIVGSVVFGARYDANTVTTTISLMRAGADGKDLNEDVQLSQPDPSVMLPSQSETRAEEIQHIKDLREGGTSMGVIRSE